MRSPLTQRSKRKGPVPTGFCMRSPYCSTAVGLSIAALMWASAARKAPYGAVVVMRSVRSSTTSIVATGASRLARGEPVAGSLMRSKVCLTAAASKGVPSWNVMPARSVKIQVLSSGVSHDSASQGSSSSGDRVAADEVLVDVAVGDGRHLVVRQHRR
jgi:hypothetical protein